MLPRSRADRARPRLAGLFARLGLLTVLIVAVVTALSVGRAHAESLAYPDAAQARFRVTVTGDGPDIILIPGLGASAATWDSTVAGLKGRYRLHVLNLAGFAGEPAGANASGDILAPTVEALDSYIKSRHLKKPILVGHSLGGLVSLMLARAHPEDAGRLVIVDTLPFIGVLFDPNATPERIKPTAIAMRNGIESAPAAAFAAQQQQGMARMANSPDAQKLVLGWSLTSDRHVFAQAFYEDLITDLRPDLPAIQTPIVLLYPVDTAAGQTEETTGPFYASNYAAAPKVRLVPVLASRHFIMLDQPDAFARVMDEALK